MAFDNVQCLCGCVHCMWNLPHPTMGICLGILAMAMHLLVARPALNFCFASISCTRLACLQLLHICRPLPGPLLTQHAMQVLLKRNTKPPELPTSGTVRKVKAEDLAPKVNKGNGQPFIAFIGNVAIIPGSTSAASIWQ
jgi:hypothetical protein